MSTWSQSIRKSNNPDMASPSSRNTRPRINVLSLVDRERNLGRRTRIELDPGMGYYEALSHVRRSRWILWNRSRLFIPSSSIRIPTPARKAWRLLSHQPSAQRSRFAEKFTIAFHDLMKNLGDLVGCRASRLREFHMLGLGGPTLYRLNMQFSIA